MAADQLYRNGIRRAHRTLGSYLVQWAWTKGVDCVVISRPNYLKFAGVKVTQAKRIAWLREDLMSMFPHSKPMSKGSRWATLYLSRLEFPDGFPFHGVNSMKKRVRKLNAAGLRTAVVTFPNETVVVAAMARVASGLTDFSDAPWSLVQ